MVTFKEFLRESADQKWKAKQSKDCICPSAKKANEKCPIHGAKPA